MRKIHIMFAVLAIFLTQQTFAHGTEGKFKQCEVIAKACLNAGFVKAGSTDKSFWHHCMKPVLLGKTVSGVDVSPKDVKACKHFKIKKMKRELEELQQSK